MTTDEAVDKLGAIWYRQQQRGTREEDHIEADVILLDLIDDEDVSTVFLSIRKWYA